MNESIKNLVDAIEKSNCKIVFGLESQGHIPTIEAELKKWNNNESDVDMTYTKVVWDSIGKKIGWCPMTASLSYFKYLNNNTIKK